MLILCLWYIGLSSENLWKKSTRIILGLFRVFLPNCISIFVRQTDMHTPVYQYVLIIVVIFLHSFFSYTSCCRCHALGNTANITLCHEIPKLQNYGFPAWDVNFWNFRFYTIPLKT